jgi:hypothetical protein
MRVAGSAGIVMLLSPVMLPHVISDSSRNLTISALMGAAQGATTYFLRVCDIVAIEMSSFT